MDETSRRLAGDEAAPSGGTPAGWRWTLALAGFALGVRLLVLGLTLLLAPAEPAGVAALHDGRENLLVAESLRPGAEAAELPPAARRLAPGYPLLVLLAATVMGPAAAALAVAMLGAAAAAALLHRLGLPPAAVALFAVLAPSWIAFTATAMSEGPFVALALAGLLAWRRAERPGRGAGGARRHREASGVLGVAPGSLAAGLAFGAAALVRPVGAVLFAALWLVRLRRRRWAPLPWAAAGFVLPPAAWLAVSWLQRGGPPPQLAAYLAKDAAPPLAGLAAGLAQPFADPLKWLQVVAWLALVAVAAVSLARRRRGSGEGDWLAWLLSQVLFYLLLPSVWVFECLARFLVPALPAVAAALAPLLPAAGPRRRWTAAAVIGGLGAGGVAVAVWWNLRALEAL
jgi:hypothetical protein